MNAKIDISELVEFQKKLETIGEKERDEFIRKLTNEAAMRLLGKVRARTPVGKYPAESGKTGGTLKRGWSAKSIQPLEVQKLGTSTVVTVKIINPVKYASYVEYGHRQKPGRFVPAIGKRLKKGWVEGKFMLTKSETELESELPGIIERKLKQLFNGALE